MMINQRNCMACATPSFSRLMIIQKLMISVFPVFESGAQRKTLLIGALVLHGAKVLDCMRFRLINIHVSKEALAMSISEILWVIGVSFFELFEYNDKVLYVGLAALPILPGFILKLAWRISDSLFEDSLKQHRNVL